MSFAKAKRFLEKIPIGPSPTEYNVSAASKLPGAVIPKSERFIDPKSPCVSSENGGSIKSAPCFRTPTLPKKKKLLLLSPATKTNVLFDDIELQEEELQEKIVECRNKDQFIQDLNEQIEELKEQLGHFKTEKEALNNELTVLQSVHVQLEEDHASSLLKLKGDHHLRVQELQEGINVANDQIISIKEQYTLIKAEKKAELEKLLENIDSFQMLYKNMCEAYNKELELKEASLQTKENELLNLEQQLINQQRNHAEEIEKLLQERQAEVQDIEYEMLKTITEMQTNMEREKRNCEKKITEIMTQLNKQIEDNKQEFECEKLKLLQENDAKIKQLEENSKDCLILAEIQTQAKIKDVELSWTIKLDDQKLESQAILKECEEISVYNIIQCELEKNKALEDLDIKSQEILNLANQIKSLENKIMSYKADSGTLREELTKSQRQNSQIQEELNSKDGEFDQISKQMAVDKRAYNITIRKSHDAIDVLKKRLINSDQDVIQLKAELESCELEKLQLEEQCSKLREELLETQSCINGFELDLTSRIQDVSHSFTDKIETYQSTVNESINAYIAKIEQQQGLLASLKEQLEKQEEINAIALQLNEKYQEDNSQLEEVISDNVNKITDIEKTNMNLQETLKTLEKENQEIRNANDGDEGVDSLKKQLCQMQNKSDTYSKYLEYYKTKTAEYEEELVQVADIRKKYIDKSGCYDQLLQKHDELRYKVSEQNALIDPFRKQLEEYKIQNSDLLNQVGETENQAKDLALKYAKLLGHQNHKQKIQHLIDLKNKNDDLQRGLKEAKIKEKSQSKLIEKLREELDSIKKNKKNKLNVGDKENVSSPNRTLNNSRGLVDGSPGPLRERN